MKKIFGLASVLALSSASFAASYGDAGCGLGSMIFHDQAGFVQIFSATTNGLSGNQTFGITSGTLNCGGGGSSPTALQYIESNKVALANDVARGEGEAVVALSQMLGCQDSKAFGVELQKNFNNIFPSQAVEAKAVESSIKQVIQTQALSCSAS
jgi:hypothetical protein